MAASQSAPGPTASRAVAREEGLPMTQRRPVGTPEVEGIWRDYRQSPSRDLRNRLVLQYAPLVKYVALRMRSGLPPQVDTADLMSTGILGLMGAIERFDPERGTKFETYAVGRIRGAIVDELRATDWVPRSVRARTREIESATAVLSQELGREPDAVDLARKLGRSRRQVELVLAETRASSILSLEQERSVGDDTVTLRDQLADVSSIAESAPSETISQYVTAGTARISSRAQAVLTMSYEEGRTLAEIGRILGVT